MHIIWKDHTSQVSSSSIRAILHVLNVQAKEGNAVMQLTYKKCTANTSMVSSVASDPESSITWGSGLSSTGTKKKTQFLTTKKELVTDPDDLYKSQAFLLREDCKGLQI